jgi:hypothetical protein
VYISGLVVPDGLCDILDSLCHVVEGHDLVVDEGIRFLLSEGPLSKAYAGFSGPSRNTVPDSWVSASSGDKKGTDEPRGSSEPMEKSCRLQGRTKRWYDSLHSSRWACLGPLCSGVVLTLDD